MFRILIVDRQKDLLWALKHFLFPNDNDIFISTSSDGKEALAALNHHSFDLLITELKLLGDVNAFKLIELSRKVYPQIRIILNSSLNETITKRVGRRLDADVLLQKPFSMNKMREAVEYVKKQKHLWAEKQISDAKLLDLLTILRQKRRTALVRLQYGLDEGFVAITEGFPVHAEFKELNGENALNQMLTLSGGKVHLISGVSVAFHSIPQSYIIPKEIVENEKRKGHHNNLSEDSHSFTETPPNPEPSFDPFFDTLDPDDITHVEQILDDMSGSNHSFFENKKTPNRVDNISSVKDCENNFLPHTPNQTNQPQSKSTSDLRKKRQTAQQLKAVTVSDASSVNILDIECPGKEDLEDALAAFPVLFPRKGDEFDSENDFDTNDYRPPSFTRIPDLHSTLKKPVPPPETELPEASFLVHSVVSRTETIHKNYPTLRENSDEFISRCPEVLAYGLLRLNEVYSLKCQFERSELSESQVISYINYLADTVSRTSLILGSNMVQHLVLELEDTTIVLERVFQSKFAQVALIKSSVDVEFVRLLMRQLGANYSLALLGVER